MSNFSFSNNNKMQDSNNSIDDIFNENYSFSSIIRDYNYIHDNEETIIMPFYFKFKCLRCQYKLGNSRKNHIDSIIKKIKTKFYKALHEGLKSCINLNFPRLPQSFITNTNIAFNKKYLNLSIGEIYSEFKVLPKLNELLSSKSVKKNKSGLLEVIMKSTLMDTFDCYLKSNMYKFDRNNIEKKEGIKFGKLYDFVANNIFKYYSFSKGNQKKIFSNLSNINDKNKEINIMQNSNGKNIINNVNNNVVIIKQKSFTKNIIKFKITKKKH